MNNRVNDLADYLKERIDPLLRVTNRDSEREFIAFSLRYSQADFATLASSVDAFYDTQGFSFCSAASGQVNKTFFSRWYQHMSGSSQNVLITVKRKSVSFFVTTEETPRQREVREYIQSLTSR